MVVFEKEVNIQMSNSGEKLFNQLCTSCHMINEDYIGPAMSGILERRSPEWIMNMILNPIQMLEEDSIAIELLERYNFEYMYNQNLLEEEAREILEYFRILCQHMIIYVENVEIGLNIFNQCRVLHLKLARTAK